MLVLCKNYESMYGVGEPEVLCTFTTWEAAEAFCEAAVEAHEDASCDDNPCFFQIGNEFYSVIAINLDQIPQDPDPKMFAKIAETSYQLGGEPETDHEDDDSNEDDD